ncbi:uncharacterized protein PF3D7_1120000-like [Cardiocondyla obscurior]|uniref:uncharacterized protein PF3D7_1120000-like n=1 Tax=Cardiocondyla obscurior TaxID=286306 RepID=UPI003965766A
MSEQEKEIVESGNEERKEEKGEKKIKKKMGRPAKVELLRRERANSLPILKAWKQEEKWKERQEEKGEIEGLEGFRKSVKVYRSPVKATGEKGEGGISKEGFEEVIKKMRSGFARIQAQMEEVREIKGKVLSLEERTRMLEMAKEREKKEWRKNNLIIRGIKIKSEEKKTLKEQVGEIIEATGMKAKIEDVNKIGGVNKGGYGMVWDDLKEELRKWDGAKEFEKEGNKRKKVIADRLNASF